MPEQLLHHPFELTISDLQRWKQRALVYHFFEIMQIIEGEGVRIVNENEFRFYKGMVFLFTPLDCRGFESSTAARFCSIRFSEIFLGQYRGEEERKRVVEWLKRLERIFYHHNRFQPFRIADPQDEKLVATLIGNLIEEHRRKAPAYEENLKQLVTLLLNVLARNVTMPSAAPAQSEPDEPLINRILLHVRQNIGSPEKLRLSYLAAQFHISVTYLGEYFKKLTGESLSHFIAQNRITLARQRLSNSTVTLKQIADELGFSDESHFHRQFRKALGVSPGIYRKMRQPEDSAPTLPVGAA